jgi:nickel-dependent lactate racemase
VKAVEKEVRRNFVMGGHKALTSKGTAESPHYGFVCRILWQSLLKTARAVNDALNEAFKIAGSASRVWAMPQGSYTLPVYKAPEENKS